MLLNKSNNGRLTATGVYSTEPASVNEVYWYFTFSNITVTVHQENGTREYLIKSKILSIPEK
jgi:hypothetical protein